MQYDNGSESIRASTVGTGGATYKLNKALTMTTNEYINFFAQWYDGIHDTYNKASGSCTVSIYPGNVVSQV